MTNVPDELGVDSPLAKAKWLIRGAIAGGIVLAVVLLVTMLVPHPQPALTATTPDAQLPAVPAPVLRVGKWTWTSEYDYMITAGTVTNVSSEPLEDVEAVITFTTKTGEFITYDTGLIEYRPLMPGQTSPWKIMTKANPLMAHASLDFKSMGGGLLRTTQ